MPFAKKTNLISHAGPKLVHLEIKNGEQMDACAGVIVRHFKNTLVLEVPGISLTLRYPNNIKDSRTHFFITTGVFSQIVNPTGYHFERSRPVVSDTLQGCVCSIRPLFPIHHEFCAASLTSFTSSMRSDWRAAAGFIQPFTSNTVRDNDVPRPYSSQRSNQFIALAICVINRAW